MVAWGCGRREGWTTKEQEEHFGGDGSYQYLDCGSFTGVTTCQNLSDCRFNWTQCIVCKLKFNKIDF